MPEAAPVLPEVLPIKSVAAQLRLSIKTLIRMADKGEFPKLLKLGAKNFVLADELRQWFEARQASR